MLPFLCGDEVWVNEVAEASGWTEVDVLATVFRDGKAPVLEDIVALWVGLLHVERAEVRD